MSDKKVNQEAKEYFERWYVNPLRILANIPNGDGAFIALATCCFLYERYADVVIKEAGKNLDEQSRIIQLTTDFGTDQETAKMFWEVMRHGILHQGMPKQKDRSQKLPSWQFLHEFPQPIKLKKTNDQPDELQVQPWLFVNKVIALCEQKFDLLVRNDSFPWARIIILPPDSLEKNAHDDIPGTAPRKTNDDYLMATGSSPGLERLLKDDK